MNSGVYKIANISIRITYHYDEYLTFNIEKYLTKDTFFEHDIMTEICHHIEIPPHAKHTLGNLWRAESQGLRYVFAIDPSQSIQSMMIHDQDYRSVRILLNPKLLKKPSEVEYTLISVAFLEMALRHRFVPLHASAIIHQEEVIMFSAPSRTGKSTQAQLWLKTLDGVSLLNDDKPLIGMEGDCMMAYGTPFSGKSSSNINVSRPLRAIIFIEQGSDDAFRVLTQDEKVIHLFRNILRPDEPDLWDDLTRNLTRLMETIPMFLLKATMNPSAVHAVILGMNREIQHEKE